MFNLDTLGNIITPELLTVGSGLVAAKSSRNVYMGDRDVEIFFEAIINWKDKNAKVTFKYKNTKH